MVKMRFGTDEFGTDEIGTDEIGTDGISEIGETKFCELRGAAHAGPSRHYRHGSRTGN